MSLKNVQPKIIPNLLKLEVLISLVYFNIYFNDYVDTTRQNRQIMETKKVIHKILRTVVVN